MRLSFSVRWLTLFLLDFPAFESYEVLNLELFKSKSVPFTSGYL